MIAEAITALEAALLAGLDPEADPPRTSVPVPGGEILLMPSAANGRAGVKLVSVAPENPSRGLPRIQGTYVLFDETLAPDGVIDGTDLTNLRTPAVSAVAVKRLARPDARHLVVFGRGPQAHAHADAMRAILPIERVELLGRDDDRAGVGDADVICCCTTAREPLFDGALVRDDAVVVAVGSHEPEACELDAGLMRRATVVVESRTSALREAGDVIQAGLAADALVTLAELVRGDAAPAPGRPRVFKSTGMAWEDLVVATVWRR